MRALVLGSTGMLGLGVCKSLREHGAEVDGTFQKDKFNLGTQQFDGQICLRTRAKYRKSKEDIPSRPWEYGLLAKIRLKKKPTPSKFDIEELEGREFPFKD